MKFRLLGLLFPIMLILCLIPAPGNASATSGLITVKLTNSSILGNQTSFTLNIVGNYINQADNSKLSGLYELKHSENRLLLYQGDKLIGSYGSTLSITPEVYGEANYVSLNGRKYLGKMAFNIEGSYIRPSNTLPVEDYLKGVVPKEMVVSLFPLEALKAQAVAARTYAASYIGKSTIDDTQSYQVYGGYEWYAKSTEAVEATKGQILTYNGRTIGGNAIYYSSNGGLSLSNTNTWGTPLFPYFRTGKDVFDEASDSPHKNWNFSINKTQINLNNYNKAEPQTWWSSVSETDSSMMTNFKNWMYKKVVNGSNIVNPDYEMKIVGVSDVSFTNTANLAPTATLYGDITIQYILKNKIENSYRLDGNGNINVFSYTIKDESYNIRSLVGGTKMYSPYIKNVGNESDRFIVYGAGYGHGIGMSQYGAAKMAETQKHDQILSYYYPNTKLEIDESLQYAPEVVFNSLVTDLNSPQKVNTSITLTANATGNNLLYAFHLYDGNEWVEVQSYSSKNTFAWKPIKPGNYKFSVHVKDAYSNNEYDAFKTVDYTINADPVDIKDVTVSKSSPQYVSTPVTLTANAVGGSNKLYAFNVYDGTEWTVAREYSESNTFTWVPEKAGEYKFSVHVKDQYSSEKYDDYYAFTYQVNDYIKVQDVSFSLPSPQVTDKTIKLTTNATGGIEKQYKYWIYDGEWKVLSDYNASNTFNWTPTKPGKYRFSVHVKDVNSTKEYDAYKGFEYEIVAGPVKAQSITVNKPSPQPEGTALTVTANATGGTTKLYKFHLFDGSTWTVLRDYSTSNTVNWTPTKADEYKLVVHVKDQSSNKEYDSYTHTWYTINQSPVDIQGVNVSYESPQAVNVPIKLEAQASGGVTKLYKFNVYDGKTWTDLTGYVTNPSYTWTPSKPGNYKFSVHVKDSRSNASYDDFHVFYYDVVDGVKITGVTYPTEPQAVNQPVVVNATTTGGTKALYEYWVLENGVWKIAQAYSPESKLTWTPAKAGDYKFSLHVKDQHSIKEYDTYEAFFIKVN